MICIKLSGLPFKTTREDITSFMRDVPIRDIYLKLKTNGKFSGEAYIILEEDKYVESALSHNKKMLGKRFIEVSMSSMNELTESSGTTPINDGTLRLVGLPYNVTKQTILDFFEGFNIMPDGIGILINNNGRPTGEAFVQFTSQDVANKAKTKHMQNMGRRYIEIYESSLIQANYTIRHQMYKNMDTLNKKSKRKTYTWVNPLISSSSKKSSFKQPNIFCRHIVVPSETDHPSLDTVLEAASFIPQTYHPPHSGDAYNSGPHTSPQFYIQCFQDKPNPYFSNVKCTVRMRGLPYAATELDIIKFFDPIKPLTIRFQLNENGNPNGEAFVRFANISDAEVAMTKNRSKIGSRYIELFSNVYKHSADRSS